MSSAQVPIEFVAIGSIHTPFKDVAHIPVQGTANDARGTVAILPEYAEGLRDIQNFDRLWLVYMGQVRETIDMVIVPRLDESSRGVFATRSLLRPNPIGLTCVRLLKVKGATVHVEGVDMLDGTGLLDLKPYVPRFDAYSEAWAGWLEHRIPHEAAWHEEARGQHGHIPPLGG